jgi:ribonuclease HII
MLAHYDRFPSGEAGVDEAGRGCLAGPVVAAAVMLHPDKPIVGINDSKKLSAKQRARLAIEIKEKAFAYAVAEASVEEIGTLNILQASLLAMRRAIAALHTKPELLLIDGNRFTAMQGYKHVCHVKGDGRFASIAAAGILAKTHRDGLMTSLAEQYPVYGWERHFGYPTKAHREAIYMHGPSELHRMGFNLKAVN